MGFYDKVKWVLGILMVFILILTTNLIDRNSFIRVKESVASIYEDRLIAYDLIFDMSLSVHEKEVAIALSNSDFYKQQNVTLNDGLGALIDSFEHTKLTVAERTIFNDLKNNFDALQQAEEAFINSEFVEKRSLVRAITQMKENLHELSVIQLSEGRRQVSISNKAVDTVELFTHIEIYALVLMAILIQLVVMYKPKD